MKPLRKLLTIVALGTVTIITARAVKSLMRDVSRYNRLRAMSGDGPLWEDLPKMVGEIFDAEAKVPGQVTGALKSVPLDLVRYARIELM